MKTFMDDKKRKEMLEKKKRNYKHPEKAKQDFAKRDDGYTPKVIDEK